MNPTEERLRAALAARAELYDGGASAPPVPAAATEGWWDRWRAPLAVAAAVTVVTAGVGLGVALGGPDDVEPAPAPTTPPDAPSATAATSATASSYEVRLSGDVDGDGRSDEVVVERGRIRAELTRGGEATVAIRRGDPEPVGLADVGDDRLVVVAGGSAYRVDGGGSFGTVALGWFPTALLWVDDAGRLLSGTPHRVGDTTYVTTYAWTGRGTELTPTADRMHCLGSGGGSAVPEPCGTAATFVGEVGDLPELQPAPVDTVGVGDGEVVAQGSGIDGLTARLEGSTEPEVGDGAVELVVGAARLGLPGGPAPRLLFASFPAGDGVAFAVQRSVGDSSEYELYRSDGVLIAPVEVEPTAGLTLQGGGPAAGGPFTDVFLSGSGGFVSLRSEAGIDLYQDAVQWRLEGGRMVGTDLGTVCLDSLVDALDVPGAYGRCDLP
ncbi:hypothetical protein E8D34_17935 [Nocardioides sp. GY 10113]|uniref:hypothetical protein n=1 Tax=Nocardioides sp. GY 10113 TaxID=2569761 RepID=UPI0010A7EE69|nr:hypothetical protein [Nocardioides sp. GY 10113]TIC81277.1 hypothetical protein E8D34_17935 [Nocardioides sp. GY 10113]